MPKFNFAGLEKESKGREDDSLDAAMERSKEKINEISPGDNDQKVAPAQHEKEPKSDLSPEKTKKFGRPNIDVNIIDDKINEVVNDRILKLMKLGLKHELTIDNMLQYFREVEMTKLYELKRYFSDSPGIKIEKMLKFLYTSGELKRDKNNWYSLK